MLKIFMTQARKLLISLIVTQKLELKHFANQNKIKLKEEDLKYLHLNKLFKDYQ